MTSLFLNTASSYLSVAIVVDGKVLDERYLKLGKDLSKMALVEVKNMLEKNVVSLDSISEIVCVKGPGSFTGLRVGVTIAKMLAWSLNCKLVSISTLFVMACSVSDDYIVPIIDARHDCCYAAIYSRDYKVVMKEQYMILDALMGELSKLNGSYTLVSSDQFAFEVEEYQPNIQRVFEHAFRKEEDLFLFEPSYLKKTQAEEELYDKGN